MTGTDHFWVIEDVEYRDNSGPEQFWSRANMESTCTTRHHQKYPEGQKVHGILSYCSTCGHSISYLRCEKKCWCPVRANVQTPTRFPCRKCGVSRIIWEFTRETEAALMALSLALELFRRSKRSFVDQENEHLLISLLASSREVATVAKTVAAAARSKIAGSNFYDEEGAAKALMARLARSHMQARSRIRARRLGSVRSVDSLVVIGAKHLMLRFRKGQLDDAVYAESDCAEIQTWCLLHAASLILEIAGRRRNSVRQTYMHRSCLAFQWPKSSKKVYYWCANIFKKPLPSNGLQDVSGRIWVAGKEEKGTPRIMP